MAHSFGLSILVLLLLTAEAIGAEFTGMVVGVIAGLIPRPSIYEQRAHLYNSRWYMFSPGRLHWQSLPVTVSLYEPSLDPAQQSSLNPTALDSRPFVLSLTRFI